MYVKRDNDVVAVRTNEAPPQKPVEVMSEDYEDGSGEDIGSESEDLDLSQESYRMLKVKVSLKKIGNQGGHMSYHYYIQCGRGGEWQRI